jgi:hypothetical protein
LLQKKEIFKAIGKGFEERELRKIRQFYLAFPIRDSLRPELGWAHYRLILKVMDETARNFYMDECVKSNWSTRQFERQINTHFYDQPTEEELRAEIETQKRMFYLRQAEKGGKNE